jgi:glucan 1,3-beta-glucosidase
MSEVPAASADCTDARGARWAALLLVGLALVTSWGWWRDAQPVDVVDGAGSRLPCVSYAPSRHDGAARRPLTEAQVRHDLALLAQRTGCVRTYTVSEGFDRVPGVAQELGLQVLLGLWIGRDDAHNAREIERGIRLAREHRAAIRAIVVGNEVLLRHEQSPAALARYLRQVARASATPVTYADVWAFWLRHRELARDVSFVTVHVLPYWDDRPIANRNVIPYVERLHERLQQAFPGKAVLVGETGWPSAGRPRGPAATGRVEQARYLREFTQLAARRGFDFNVIEAFDQPWKIAHEGTVGGHWGLYDRHAQPKFAWTGPVVEAPAGTAIATLAMIAGLLALGLAATRRNAHARGIVAGTWAGAAALAVAVGARQWHFALDGNVTTIDWIVTGAVALLGWTALALAVRRITSSAPPPREPRVSAALALALLAAAAYVGLGLVFAGRHRDFPVWLFVPGAAALTVGALAQTGAQRRALVAGGAIGHALLATWLVASAALIPFIEGGRNLLALAWSGVSLALGLSVLVPWLVGARERERTADHAHAGPGEVVQHHPERADHDRDEGERR